MAKLKIKDDLGHERVYELLNGVTLAGRASTNSIQINDEKSSRQHFKIERKDDGYFVADLESTNGTRVNGTKLAQPAKLSSGDVISVGKTMMTFDEAGASDAELAAVAAAPVEEISQDVADRATMLSKMSSLTEGIKAELPKPATDGPKYVLKVIEGATPGKIYELGADALTLGRHASNTIQIDDEAASNYHAEVTREPVGYVLADLGSTNGTRVRLKDKTDFEKVVKAPLKPGMQIRVGKTLLDFDNIGTPVEEDNPEFGASSIDAQQLNAKLAAAPAASGSGWGLKIAAIVVLAALIGAGVWFVPKIIKGMSGGPTVPKTTEKPQQNFANLITTNPNFEGGVDEEGVPEGFKLLKGWPETSIRVAAESGGHYLQISKGGAKSLNRQTIVETLDPIKIDASKTYEFSARLRDDGEDGILGLHLTWVAGERVLPENPFVVKGANAPEWKEVKVASPIAPPAWATHVKVGVFVQGKSGKAGFDDLVFKEKAGSPQRPAPVNNGGIALQFEGRNGTFSISEGDKTIVEEGTLRLESPEVKATSDLSSALKPSYNKSENSFDGKVFDFAQQEFVGYAIGAGQVATGVELHAGVQDLSSDGGSKPVLRFYLSGAVAQGEIELGKGEGAAERLQRTDKKEDKGIKSVLFNAGKSPQFSLTFAKPVEINLVPEGSKRRLVEIRFDNDLTISMTPEDAEKKKLMLAAAADLQKSVGAKEWGSVETKSKELVEKYGGSFAQAQEEAAKAGAALEAGWKAAQDELGGMLTALKETASAELVEKTQKAFERQDAAWKGTSKEAALNDVLGAQFKSWLATYNNEAVEKEAEEIFKQAEQAFASKLFNVSIAYCKKIVAEDGKYFKTKAADKAKELMEKAQKGQDHEDQLRGITDRLVGATDNLIKLKKYMDAIQLVERDQEYMKFKVELTEINNRLKIWKDKAAAP